MNYFFILINIHKQVKYYFFKFNEIFEKFNIYIKIIKINKII